MNIRYLILVLTTRCNLQCSYCYNDDIRQPEEMSEAVLQRAIDMAAADGKPFHLQLTGGEPGLVPELIDTALVAAQRSGSCSGIGIQTNATRLTPQLLQLVKRHRVQVGVSLDGPPKIHERQRGMASATLRGLKLLEDSGISFRVTTVVTQTNAAALDRLVWLVAGYSSARGIGLDLLIRKGRACRHDQITPAVPKTLNDGLARMHHALMTVNARRQHPIRWREWDLIFQSNHRKKVPSVFCRAARSQSLAVSPDGNLFPCGQTCGDLRFAAGTVWSPQPKSAHPLTQCRPSLTDCQDCPVSAVCPGDCPSRLVYNQNHCPTLACHMYRELYRLGSQTHGGRPS
jgi:uncharacterized protein